VENSSLVSRKAEESDENGIVAMYGTHNHVNFNKII
jgi:hypothetical protein